MRSSSTILIRAYLLFLYVYTSSSFSSSAPLYFPANNVTLFGDASVENDSIRLTQDHQCTSPSQSTLESASSTSLSGIGRAFYINPIRFLDSSSKGTAASFSCSFSFNISPTPSCPFGDGLAFLVTSNMDSLSITDGWMGLPEEVSNIQDSFIAVEFDTSYNPFFDDINGNHVGVDVRQIKSLASVDVVSRGIDLKAGKEMTAWIEYRNSEKMIRVWVGYSQVRPLSPILVAQADFTGDFKEFMHVGFTASNGGGSAIHSISRWRFKTFWFRSSTLSMDTVEEGDCLACFPGDLDVNFDRSRKWKFGLILVIGGSAVITVILVAVALFVILCCIKRNRSKAKRERHIEYHVGRFQSYKVPKYLSLREIKEATKGFNEDRIIGEGASAVVYEGEIPSCGNVAIKRFTRGKSIGTSHNSFNEAWRIPFDNEFATMIGCLRHKNLVQLKGWCCERNELVLVYEYMPNGSLDKILHGRSSVTKFLTWERRSNIVLGVASALVYLHEECINQIIHRDVKACNIMLDAEFNAKLGDFGLAAVYQRSLEMRDATVPAGTMGYLAPEYVFSGVPTVKSDVYSFGVVVLEVASGRRPVDDNIIVITDWVWELWGKGKLIEAADPKLKRCFNRKVMGRMLMVGLCCTHPDHQKRPTMREAARMLQGEAPIPSLPPRKPTVRIQSVLPGGILEDIMSIGEEADDNTPWSTPRTQFSRN